MSIPADIRRELMRRCRSRRTRSATFSSAAPTEWQPWTLRDPQNPRQYLTEDRAWQLIADALEAGCEVTVIELKKPVGKKGYVLLLDGCQAAQKIYIKLQLRSNDVLGRSFHETKLPRRRDALLPMEEPQ